MPDPPTPIPTNRIVANAIATFFCLLLFAVAAFAIGSSGASRGELCNIRFGGYWILSIDCIGIELRTNPPKPRPIGGPIGQPEDSRGFEWLGICLARKGLEWRNANVHWTYTSFALPWWLVGLFGVRPLFRALCRFDAERIRNKNARKHANERHCAVCGYDLRATPDRCPECGTKTRPAEM